jgi:hypothetical protein
MRRFGPLSEMPAFAGDNNQGAKPSHRRFNINTACLFPVYLAGQSITVSSMSLDAVNEQGRVMGIGGAKTARSIAISAVVSI